MTTVESNFFRTSTGIGNRLKKWREKYQSWLLVKAGENQEMFEKSSFERKSLSFLYFIFCSVLY